MNKPTRKEWIEGIAKAIIGFLHASPEEIRKAYEWNNEDGKWDKGA